MGSLLEIAEFSLTVSLCISQLLISVIRSILYAVETSLARENSFEEFMCSFWFLALCGCVTKRRHIIVFTTMAMFYSFILSFRWATSAHYSYLNGTPVPCTRMQRQFDGRWCNSADSTQVMISITAVLITIFASVLSALRLWSEEGRRVEERRRRNPEALLNPCTSSNRKAVISAILNTID